MTDAEIRAKLVDRSVLALTAWAEARQIPRSDPKDHSPVEELLAVMCVIRNRTKHGASYRDVCLAPKQFSCWNDDGSKNHLALIEQMRLLVSAVSANLIDPELKECLVLADAVIAGTIIDRTGGAVNYYAPAAMVPPGRVPSWAAGKRYIEIGDQYFIQP